MSPYIQQPNSHTTKSILHNTSIDPQTTPYTTYHSKIDVHIVIILIPPKIMIIFCAQR